MEQFDRDVSDFLLAVHEASHALSAEDFQYWTLRELRTRLDFDFAIWGAGDGRSREVHTATVLDQSPDLFATWEPVKHEDRFANLVIGHTGRTWALTDLPAEVRRTRAYNEHWRLYDAAQMLSTMEVDPDTGLHVFITLCRDARSAPFADADRRLKGLLTRHLFLAAKHNDRFHLAGQRYPARTAIVDARGRLHTAGSEFRALITEEWRAEGRYRLPAVALEQPRGHYQGRIIRIDFMPLGNRMIARAAPCGPLDALSERESAIARHYASGGSYKEVARSLGISPNTVRNHLQSVYRKLGVRDKGALANLCR